jgi:hypothetical protein
MNPPCFLCRGRKKFPKFGSVSLRFTFKKMMKEFYNQMVANYFSEKNPNVGSFGGNGGICHFPAQKALWHAFS